MKIVIISQHSYPFNSPRSHRTTELAKELVRAGHEVVVYALLGEYDYTNYTKETGIVFKNLGKTKWGLVSNTGGSNSRIVGYLASKIGRYTQFPYTQMIPMVKNAIREEETIDLLITIAVPHIIHYATSRADLRRVKYWIADCGDPFMGNAFVWHPFYFERFERQWCSKCDSITIPIGDAIAGYYPEYHSKIRVIPQGFDFSNVRIANYTPHSVPTFAYAGAVYKDYRDPSAFLEFLCGLEINFVFVVYGRSWNFFEPYKNRLGEKLIYGGLMPHDDMITAISAMDFLINIPNKSSVQQPSKLIDYALAKRPIINISTDFPEEEKLSFLEFMQGDYTHRIEVGDIERFNIKNVAQQFIDLAQGNSKNDRYRQ